MFEGVYQFSEDKSVTIFRGTPTSKHFAFEFTKLRHHFIIFKEIFFESIDTLVSPVLIDFEGVGPLARNSSRDVVIISTNIHVVLLF